MTVAETTKDKFFANLFQIPNAGIEELPPIDESFGVKGLEGVMYDTGLTKASWNIGVNSSDQDYFALELGEGENRIVLT